MNTHKMPLDSIRIDGDTHTRVAISSDVIAEYAERLDELPPVTVHYDGTHYWLTDGFHRYHAARKAGTTMIRVEVRSGSLEDARWFATSANRTHGLRRTNADKHRAVVAALRLRPNQSDRAIAEHVGVSHGLVGVARAELAAKENLASSGNRISRDGHVINTANIGRRARPNRRNGTPTTRPTDRPRMGESHVAESPGGLERHPSINGILHRLAMLVNMPLSEMSRAALVRAVEDLKNALDQALRGNHD
jgi:hypothetical protein